MPGPDFIVFYDTVAPFLLDVAGQHDENKYYLFQELRADPFAALNFAVYFGIEQGIYKTLDGLMKRQKPPSFHLWKMRSRYELICADMILSLHMHEGKELQDLPSKAITHEFAECARNLSLSNLANLIEGKIMQRKTGLPLKLPKTPLYSVS